MKKMTFLRFIHFVTINLLIINFWWKSINADLELAIFHTNDVHARYDEVIDKNTRNRYGGTARVAYLLKKAREEHEAGKGPPVLYVDAGDMFTGSIWFTVHSYQGVADVFNILKPDAFNIGSHEIDTTIDGLLNFTQLIKFPMICTNMKWNENSEFGARVKRSLIKIIDGVKIGILGYLRSELIRWADTGTIEFLDIIIELRKECQRLTYEDDVHIIIALGNAGYETDKLIAHGVDCIDLIVGGYSHTFLWNGVPPDSEVPDGPYPTTITRNDGSLVLIVQAYGNLKYLGKIILRFKRSDGTIKGFFGSPILLNSKIPQDPEMQGMVDEMRKDLVYYDKKFLTKCNVYLDGTNCQYQECNFGNLLIDAIIEYRANQYQGPGWTDAAVALLNSGTLIDDIDAPQQDHSIFYGDVMRALPYADFLYIVEIKGSDLLFVLEISAASSEVESAGEFLLMGGLKVMIDFEDRFGKRVKLVKIRCAQCDVPKYFELDPEERYKVILSNHLLKGGAGYTLLRDVVWNPTPIGVKDTDVMIRYLERVCHVIPEVGGRLLKYDKHKDKTKSNHCFSIRSNVYRYFYFRLMLSIFVMSILE